MKVEAVDPKTGNAKKMECAVNSEGDICDLLSFVLSEEALKRKLDRLTG